MSSLTQAAGISRLVIKFGLIALAVLIVGRVVLSYSLRIYKQLNPAPPPPPTYGFGTILPDLKFPLSEYDNPDEIILETADGSLPPVPLSMRVYQVQTSRPNLLALDQASQKALGFGFTQEPIRLNESVYRWSQVEKLSDGQNYPLTLLYRIYDGTFEYTLNWTVNQSFLLTQSLPSQTQAIRQVEQYLSQQNLIPDDMPQDNWVTTYLRWIGGDYAPTSSLSEADFVRVDLFRNKLEDLYPSVTSKPGVGSISAITSGLNQRDGLVKVQYNYFYINQDSPETYPTKSAAEALTELRDGKGYLARFGLDRKKATIRRVYLAYYESYEPQQYYQPVWVFEGDDNFLAYVPALRRLAQ